MKKKKNLKVKKLKEKRKVIKQSLKKMIKIIFMRKIEK